MQIDCLHRIAYWHAKPETSTPEILRRFFTDSLENLWRIFGESLENLLRGGPKRGGPFNPRTRVGMNLNM